MRAVFTRVNRRLETNWTLHDLRHTCAIRMANDPKMPLVTVQTLLGHAHLTTTQRYLKPHLDQVVAHRTPSARGRTADADGQAQRTRLRRRQPSRALRVAATGGSRPLTTTDFETRASTSSPTGAPSTSDGTSLAAGVPSPDATWPQSPLSRAALAESAYKLSVGSQNPERCAQRRHDTDRLLAWLENWPGRT